MSTCPYNCKKGKVFLESRGFVNCPHCTSVERVVETVEKETGKSLYDVLQIPVMYQTLGVADEELFNVQGLGGFSENSIKDVSNIMKKINSAIFNHKVLNLSVYLYTSNLVDVKRFVYGSLKMALEKGLQVTPFISANMLYGLQRVGDFSITSLKDIKNKNGELKDVHPDLIHAVDGYRLVQETDLTYYDFINADICFISATANTTKKGWTGLADLLEERSKKGLPTYVIGYWGTKNMGGGTTRDLRYLLASDSGHARLDLLVPYELESNRGGQEGAYISKPVPDTTTKSGVTSGITLSGLLD